ncbi:MAG: antitoxin VapB family protein [Nanoarchaeota archaeon]|nr:antitoxin VapB family protein [Nanoarchaeota archaeon]
MVTKTITITEAAYGLLAQNKVEGESFSQEITRMFIVQKKKKLLDFFGILSDEVAGGMREDLQKLKATNIKQLKEKLKYETA